MGREAKWINYALSLIDVSSQTGYVHVAVIVESGRPVSVGRNRKTYGKVRLPITLNCEFHSLHAEIDAIRRVDPRRLRDADMYVVGVKKGGSNPRKLYSKPCAACAKVLRRYPDKLRAVYFSDENGHCKELRAAR